MANYNPYDIYAALYYPVCDQEGSERMAKAFKSKDSSPDEKKSVLDTINARLKMIGDAITGEPFSEEVQDIVDKRFGSKRKWFDTVDGVTDRMVNTHDVLFSRFKIDTNWMQFYQNIDARGTNRLSINELTNKVVFKEYRMGETIQPTPFGDEDVSYLHEKRYGGALNFLNRWLETNGRYNLNEAIRRFAIASLKIKANTMYTTLADTSGVSVEAFATSIIVTANNCADNLLDGLDSNDPQYDVTDETPLLILSHSTNKPLIRAAWRTISGDNGTNILPEYNVTPVFTRNPNVTYDLGSGTASAVMCLPEEDAIFAMFKDLRISTRQGEQEDALIIVGQEYWNHQHKAIQRRIMRLA